MRPGIKTPRTLPMLNALGPDLLRKLNAPAVAPTIR
jgi:hypothetical protein